MALNPWLPIGYKLPTGGTCRSVLHEGIDWQILAMEEDCRALIVGAKLASSWISSGLIDATLFAPFEFGGERLYSFVSSSGRTLAPISECKSPGAKSEALAFASALKSTRAIDPKTPLQDALYVEKISRLLPTYSLSSRTDDDIVLGYWLTGGAHTSAKSFRRLCQMMTWLQPHQLSEILEAAGMEIREIVPASPRERAPRDRSKSRAKSSTAEADAGATSLTFNLPGRAELESFFREHILDILQNRDRYQALGIGFPSAVVLQGPPGTGKTFAVDRLIEFLGWPSFQIDAASVASPFIHETSRKVAEVFDSATENAPSVLVIDEMEAFLADREMGSSHHRVEEVAEFLRRIPEASKNNVLILAMTNRIDMIDSAVLRRGRFDHVIEVGFANYEEVLSLLKSLLSEIAKEEDINPEPLAKKLEGRPLSDVAFVVREGARLAARARKGRLDQASLLSALAGAPTVGEGSPRRIGFV